MNDQEAHHPFSVPDHFSQFLLATPPHLHAQAASTAIVASPTVAACSFFTASAAAASFFFCFSAHSRLAVRPLSAASALAFFAASSFSRLAFSMATFSNLSRPRISFPFCLTRSVLFVVALVAPASDLELGECTVGSFRAALVPLP